MFVRLKLDSKLVVKDAQVAVRPAHDELRGNRLHLLGDHADIVLVAAVIAEAIEAKSVREPAEQDNVVLERDIGSATAAAMEAAAASSKTTSAAAAGEAGVSAHRLCARNSA